MGDQSEDGYISIGDIANPSDADSLSEYSLSVFSTTSDEFCNLSEVTGTEDEVIYEDFSGMGDAIYMDIGAVGKTEKLDASTLRVEEKKSFDRAAGETDSSCHGGYEPVYKNNPKEQSAGQPGAQPAPTSGPSQTAGGEGAGDARAVYSAPFPSERSNGKLPFQQQSLQHDRDNAYSGTPPPLPRRPYHDSKHAAKKSREPLKPPSLVTDLQSLAALTSDGRSASKEDMQSEGLPPPLPPRHLQQEKKAVYTTAPVQKQSAVEIDSSELPALLPATGADLQHDRDNAYSGIPPPLPPRPYQDSEHAAKKSREPLKPPSLVTDLQSLAALTSDGRSASKEDMQSEGLPPPLPPRHLQQKKKAVYTAAPVQKQSAVEVDSSELPALLPATGADLASSVSVSRAEEAVVDTQAAPRPRLPTPPLPEPPGSGVHRLAQEQPQKPPHPGSTPSASEEAAGGGEDEESTDTDSDRVVFV